MFIKEYETTLVRDINTIATVRYQARAPSMSDRSKGIAYSRRTVREASYIDVSVNVSVIHAVYGRVE